MRTWRGLALVAIFSIIGLPGLLPASAQVSPDTISASDVASAERLWDIRFSEAERDSMLDGLQEQKLNYRGIRSVGLANSVLPSILFNPIPAGFVVPKGKSRLELSPPSLKGLPANDADLAFASVADLAHLVRTRQISSERLTRLYLDRLKKHGPALECVVTLTEDLAMEQARRADREIRAGKYRGPLHGIPYGAKDLLATRGIATTWGSAIYRNQTPHQDATVIRKLEEAGAILVAKLTMGELAWGDVWFGGKTRNPWDRTQGSSGSSAGSAAATSAGLVAFAIGTETWGSIISPSTRCGVTGLRPTYGRVSRSGAMALSWSMDKIGPICRTVEDCAIVLEAIRGGDGTDPTVIDAPLVYRPGVPLKEIRLGYLKQDFDSAKSNRANDAASLEKLRQMGARLVPTQLPALPVGDLSIILSAEAAAAFDELTLSGKDDLMVRQIKNAWPNAFRTARTIPAVEYIQANRVRTLLIARMQELMKDIDVYIAPTGDGDNLLLTNLTGHPSICIPNGFDEKGRPTSITLVGRLFDEGRLLSVAKALQDATPFHLKRPPTQE
jgi:Asp-tRNA(Asn)/Glu-tRNA(Gln) amidotransferase A subunit family amidase